MESKGKAGRWEKMKEVSERIDKIRKDILKTTPEIFTDRALLLTESYEKTLGQPYLIRRAKALENILCNMDICIQEEQLIVGSFAGKPRGCQVYPEYGIDFLIEELDTFEVRKADRFIISEENKEILKSIYTKWKNNTIPDFALRNFPDNAREYSEDQIYILTALRSGVGHVIVDYEKVLTLGLNSIIRQIHRFKKNIAINDPEYQKKMSYYKAVEIVCEAAIQFASRFADLAEEKAQTVTEEKRKNELLKIAQICRRVPAQPATSFWEALQSFWFIHLILHIESNGHSISPGRFDQYMYPFYKKDLENGNLSKSMAEELIHCLWLKFFELNKVRDKVSSIAFGGYPMFQNLIVGGQTSDGECAVNELSYLCLDATAKIGLPQPSLSVRWYYGCPEEFITAALRVASYGTGMPAFFNDEVLIPNMLQLGYSLEEARNYAIVGCTETVVPGICEPWLTGGFINILKILELTINNGYDPILKKQYKFKTGEVEEFSTFDEFKEAYFQQLAYYLKNQIICDNILDKIHAELCPTPFESVFINNCLENAATSLEGGAKYNFTTLEAVGIANVADSLAAIKKLIYEEKKISWGELKQALANNFANKADLRLLLINGAPKYGNDIDYVDKLGNEVLAVLRREVDKYTNPRGGKYNIALYSIASHVLFGPKTGATPDGRAEKDVLADGGVSCFHGRDKKGLTALFNSVVKLDPFKATGSNLLNVKLNPSLLKGDSFYKILSVIKTYFLRKGQHVQFNVVDAETLRDAQKNPEQYQALTVRVAGFSVLFTTIDPLLQDDIIRRTEYHQLS